MSTMNRVGHQAQTKKFINLEVLQETIPFEDISLGLQMNGTKSHLSYTAASLSDDFKDIEDKCEVLKCLLTVILHLEYVANIPSHQLESLWKLYQRIESGRNRYNFQHLDDAMLQCTLHDVGIQTDRTTSDGFDPYPADNDNTDSDMDMLQADSEELCMNQPAITQVQPIMKHSNTFASFEDEPKMESDAEQSSSVQDLLAQIFPDASDFETYQSKIEAYKSEVDTHESEVDTYMSEIDTPQSEIDTCQSEVDIQNVKTELKENEVLFSAPNEPTTEIKENAEYKGRNREDREKTSKLLQCGGNIPAIPVRNKKFDCGQCDKSFSKKPIYLGHLRGHEGLIPFICSTCGRGYQTWSGYISHRQSHKPLTPWICDICGKSFKISGLFNTHLKSHDSIKQYPCNICGHRSATSSGNINHQKIHRIVKIFECKICGDQTKTRAENIIHMKIHSENNICRVCGKSYPSVKKTTAHMTRSHIKFIT